MTDAHISVVDPIQNALLPLLKDGINARFAEHCTRNGWPVIQAIDDYAHGQRTVDQNPSLNESLTKGGFLSCYRVKAERRKTTMYHDRDIASVLQLEYTAPPATASNVQLANALLSFVWEAALDIIDDGYHPAHQNGARVLDDAGVVSTDTSVDRNSKQMGEGRAEADGIALPKFTGQVGIVWRTNYRYDVMRAPTVPFLGFRADIYTDGLDPTEGDAPLVQADATLSDDTEEPFSEESNP